MTKIEWFLASYLTSPQNIVFYLNQKWRNPLAFYVLLVGVLISVVGAGYSVSGLQSQWLIIIPTLFCALAAALIQRSFTTDVEFDNGALHIAQIKRLIAAQTFLDQSYQLQSDGTLKSDIATEAFRGVTTVGEIPEACDKYLISLAASVLLHERSYGLGHEKVLKARHAFLQFFDALSCFSIPHKAQTWDPYFERAGVLVEQYLTTHSDNTRPNATCEPQLA